jgi:hypothetical protein
MRMLPVLLVVATGVVGCGQGDDRAAVRSVTNGFLSAYAAQRGPAACAALSADTRAELVSSEGEACARAIGSLQLHGGRITKVEIQVTDAKVDLSSGESLYLGKTTNGWRLSALGCRPKDGPPTRFPLTCELQA